MTMLDDFLVRAGLAGVGTALAAAPLGCFVVWRRMAYFGDATAHAALLGVALSLAFQGPIILGVLATALIMAFLVMGLSGRGLAEDTLLGVLAHAALAFGLVSVSFLSGVRVDLMGYLFGDILAVSKTDLAIIWTGAAVVIGLMLWRWQRLLTTTLNPDLAQASGISARVEQLVLTVALALTVAVAIKAVGALLIGALLVIPPAAARPLARTPEAMAILTACVGVLSTLGGLGLAFELDTPTGPTIVCTATGLFVVGAVFGRFGRTG
ncbi:metal ABC transporter permease [uncultured Tateyamaria sp.]|uniref:metal ABC transporter permease n=1 Tax=uncultured Tateyamaria sp. TaxID=455651 RepID=UPI00263106FE|nr:metal ABC transporter permease [uncultured Tateyamaria sp.]